MTRVKICGVRTARAAAQACVAGADAIGLVFYPPSKRFVSLDDAVAVLGGIAPLVTTVGLFVDPDADDVLRVLESCALDCLQFHGQESAAFCQQFRRPYIKAISMRPDVALAPLLEEHRGARAILFDAWRADTPGGTGDTFAWDRLPALDQPWILAGGLHADNVGAAISQLAPPAVDVSGGVERAPGEKDAQRMRDFVAAVRAADQQCKEPAI